MYGVVRKVTLTDSSDKPDDQMRLLAITHLNEAVTEISKNCFELKKLCATLIVSAAVIIQAFTKTTSNSQLDGSYFIGAALIIGFFYLLDADSNFYQALLRHRMNQLAVDWQRNKGIDPTKKLVDASPGATWTSSGRMRWWSFYNRSMLYYWLLFLMDLAIYLFYVFKWIRT